MLRWLRSPAGCTALLAVLLALALIGGRGIWDPDEGRYTNVALNMLDSGDWLNPRRHHEVGHWTKPPLTYWAIAGSVGVFGYHPSAARLPAALAYLMCVWLTWRIARRLAPGSEAVAATAYATMLLPFGASQLITTDYLLAAWTTLALWAFVESEAGAPAHARRWLALMWTGFALAFMTKGPPGLLMLLVILAHRWLLPTPVRHHVLEWSGLLVFALLALPWYVAVIHGHPGLFRYFVGDEVVNRVTTNEFGRHGEWYGWLTVYLPTLLIGTLPWTPTLWRWARGLPAQLRAWRQPLPRRIDAAWLLPTLWLLLPLLVFCLARSRMPLYLLPLWTPLALLVALQWRREGRSLPRWPWLLGWVVLLLALRLGTVVWPSHKDARQWAEAIRVRHPGPLREITFVDDMARYGLHLHLGPQVQIEKIASVSNGPRPQFNPPFDETLAEKLAEHEREVLWICKQADWPALQARIAAAGYRARALGTPYRERVMFEVQASR